MEHVYYLALFIHDISIDTLQHGVLAIIPAHFYILFLPGPFLMTLGEIHSQILNNICY